MSEANPSEDPKYRGYQERVEGLIYGAQKEADDLKYLPILQMNRGEYAENLLFMALLALVLFLIGMAAGALVYKLIQS